MHAVVRGQWLPVRFTPCLVCHAFVLAERAGEHAAWHEECA